MLQRPKRKAEALEEADPVKKQHVEEIPDQVWLKRFETAIQSCRPEHFNASTDTLLPLVNLQEATTLLLPLCDVVLNYCTHPDPLFTIGLVCHELWSTFPKQAYSWLARHEHRLKMLFIDLEKKVKTECIHGYLLDMIQLALVVKKRQQQQQQPQYMREPVDAYYLLRFQHPRWRLMIHGISASTKTLGGILVRGTDEWDGAVKARQLLLNSSALWGRNEMKKIDVFLEAFQREDSELVTHPRYTGVLCTLRQLLLRRWDTCHHRPSVPIHVPRNEAYSIKTILHMLRSKIREELLATRRRHYDMLRAFRLVPWYRV